MRAPSETATATESPLRGSASSWLAVVAAATLSSSARVVRAVVHIEGRASVAFRSAQQRLVVQLYDAKCWEHDGPGRGARPLASAQRAVSLDELREGVSVRLLEIVAAGKRRSKPGMMVIAWLEPGVSDLVLDGLSARPRLGCPRACARLVKSNRSTRLALSVGETAGSSRAATAAVGRIAVRT